MSEQMWMEKAQSAEARIAPLSSAVDDLKGKLRDITETFGVKRNFNGTVAIDYDKLVENLGPEQCLILRGVIDEKYRISGNAGEKPRIRASA